MGQPVFSGEGGRYRRGWGPARRGRDEALAWVMIDVDVSIPGLRTVIFRALPENAHVRPVSGAARVGITPQLCCKAINQMRTRSVRYRSGLVCSSARFAAGERILTCRIYTV